MARPTGPQNDAAGDAALFAYVAARVAGKDSEEEMAAVGSSVGLTLAGRTLRTVPRKARRLREQDRGRGRELVKPTVIVPAGSLDLFEALVRLRPDEQRREVSSAVADVAGVLEVMRAERHGDLFVLVVYERARERRELEGRLAEFGEVSEWVVLDEHSREPAVKTWVAFARRAFEN